jgi:hypothetical protein
MEVRRPTGPPEGIGMSDFEFQGWGTGAHAKAPAVAAIGRALTAAIEAGDHEQATALSKAFIWAQNVQQ